MEAIVASRISCICECASVAPANGMITSEGIGMHADWTAIRMKTTTYLPPTLRPINAAMIFSVISIQYTRVHVCHYLRNHATQRPIITPGNGTLVVTE